MIRPNSLLVDLVPSILPDALLQVRYPHEESKLELLQHTRCLGQLRGGNINGEASGLSRRGGASIGRWLWLD